MRGESLLPPIFSSDPQGPSLQPVIPGIKNLAIGRTPPCSENEPFTWLSKHRLSPLFWNLIEGIDFCIGGCDILTDTKHLYKRYPPVLTITGKIGKLFEQFAYLFSWSISSSSFPLRDIKALPF
jgi:hypothetical protein